MELKEVFTKRRSVNFFDPKRAIDEDLLRKIYDIAKLVPSSFNLQPWKLILVRDPANKKKLRAAAFNQPKAEEASAMLILLADKNGYEEISKIADDFIGKGYFSAAEKAQYVSMANGLYGNPFASRGFAMRNAGLFAMGFMLAAKDFGVDTHPMDGFDQDKVRQSFNIPEQYEVAMLMAVGYHDDKKALLPRLNRKGFDEVVIREGF
jgi:nitroreductase